MWDTCTHVWASATGHDASLLCYIYGPCLGLDLRVLHNLYDIWPGGIMTHGLALNCWVHPKGLDIGPQCRALYPENCLGSSTAALEVLRTGLVPYHIIWNI